MMILNDKGRCKRKEFIRALIPNHYVYLEFMNHKTSKLNRNWYVGGIKRTRDMSPNPKIFKVIDKNCLQLVYHYDKIADKWIKSIDFEDPDIINRYDIISWNSKKSIKLSYKSYNIWYRFQRDEIRNIRIMTKEEFIENYLFELL